MQFYLLISLFFSLHNIHLPYLINRAITVAVIVFSVYYVVLGINHLIDYASRGHLAKIEASNEDITLPQILVKFVKVIVWNITLLKNRWDICEKVGVKISF